MNFKHLQRFLPFLLFFFACQEEKTPVLSPNQLNGYWVVQSATRNDKPTGVLEGVYFEFDTQKSELTTDLPITEEGGQFSATYKLDKNTLQLQNPTLPMKVLAFTDSTLELGFETRGFQFALTAFKSVKPLPQDTLPTIDTIPAGE